MLLKKKRIEKIGAAGLGIVLLGITACSGGQSNGRDEAETFNFTVASAVAQSHPSGQATTQWMERVEELTDGRVTFDAIWSGALLPGDELLAGVSDGRADIVHTSSSWHMSDLPYTSITTVPFINLDGEASARALNELFVSNEVYRGEFEAHGIRLVSAQPLDVALLGSNSAYSEPSALRGQQIRATGEWIDALTQIGAEPVGVAYGETYEALQRGVVDGYALNWEGIYDLQLHEVAPVVEDPGIGQISNMMLIMNDGVWQGLSADIQEAIDQATEEHVDGLSPLYESLSEEQCSIMVDNGAEFLRWDDSAMNEWRDQVADGILQDWVDSKVDSDEAQAFLDEYIALMDDAEDTSAWTPGIEICMAIQGD